jgi:hypothetical protein
MKGEKGKDLCVGERKEKEKEKEGIENEGVARDF